MYYDNRLQSLKTHAIQYCKIHSHNKNLCRKVNPLRDIAEQLVVETLNKKSIPALIKRIVTKNFMRLFTVHTLQKDEANRYT